MVDLKQSLAIVKKNNPNDTPAGCLDYGDFYAFSLRPKSIPEGAAYETGPWAYGVLKHNGEPFMFNIMENADAYLEAKQVDISSYLKHSDPTGYLMSLGCNMDTDIVHYGTKHHSGRYPWGSGKRPYQGEGGRETGSAKKSVKRQGYFARKKAARQRKETLKKARAAADAKRRYEADKERAINSGDIKFAYENRYRLTDAELNKVLQRVDMNRKLESALKDLSNTSSNNPQTKKNGKEYMKLKSQFPGFDNFMNNLGTVNGWMATGLKTYQNIQAVQNILNGNQQKGEKNQEQKPKEEKKKK